MKGPQNSETFRRATNACSDFRTPERARSAAFTAEGHRGPGKRVPLGRRDERARRYHQPPPPQTGVNAPHPVTRATLQSDTQAQDSASRATQKRRIAGRPLGQTPPSLGGLMRWGTRPLHAPGSEAPPPAATRPRRSRFPARGGRDCTGAVSLRAPASVSFCLPGTLRVGAPRKDRTHARAYVPP